MYNIHNTQPNDDSYSPIHHIHHTVITYQLHIHLTFINSSGIPGTPITHSSPIYQIFLTHSLDINHTFITHSLHITPLLPRENEVLFSSLIIKNIDVVIVVNSPMFLLSLLLSSLSFIVVITYTGTGEGEEEKREEG